jgi:hypothetical protein
MSKKPYIYESLEGWLQITRKKSWNDPTVNPQDLAPYSEFQKPYANDKDMSYPEWEWTWPDDWVGPPIDDLTYPDPISHPCSIDEDCIWAGVIGPDEMECDDCYTFTQAHLFLGCDIAPWWAAFGSWKLETSITDGECSFLFSGPIMATVCCDEDAEGSFIITYLGPLDCKGGIEVSVSCDKEPECCEFELTGAASVNPGNLWVGTVTPACPGAECEVTSGSGCDLSCGINMAGSEVTVGTSGGDCGMMTVTVTDPTQDCSGSSAKSVRITGGQWEHEGDCLGGAVSPCNVACSPGCGGAGQPAYYYDHCFMGEYKYGGFGGMFEDACSGGWSSQCRHIPEPEESCTPSGSQPPCMSKTMTCGECIYWGWWRCNYVCEC